MGWLDQAANWATLILAVVAVGFAVNTYGYSAVNWLFGNMRHGWPLDVKATRCLVQIDDGAGEVPNSVTLWVDLEIRPARGAWNPRRPIEISRICVDVFGQGCNLQFSAIAPNPVDRLTLLTNISGSCGIEQLPATSKLALLRRKPLEIKVTTTQAPRAVKTCVARVVPERIGRANNTIPDADAMIAQLERRT